MWQRDTERRIKENRDDMLIQVIDLHVEKLSSDIKNTEQRLDQRMDGLVSDIKNTEQRLDQRMDGLDKRMDGLDKRMDGLDKRMDNLNQEVKEINQRMDRHLEQTLSIKRWIIGLVISILLGIFLAAFPVISTAINSV